MNGYAYQMNAALDKIKEMMRVNAELQKKHDDLVLENTSLRLAVEDMAGLRDENLKLKGQLNEFVERMERQSNGDK
jgi:hypothetical protein